VPLHPVSGTLLWRIPASDLLCSHLDLAAYPWPPRLGPLYYQPQPVRQLVLGCRRPLVTELLNIVLRKPPCERCHIIPKTRIWLQQRTLPDPPAGLIVATAPNSLGARSHHCRWHSQNSPQQHGGCRDVSVFIRDNGVLPGIFAVGFETFEGVDIALFGSRKGRETEWEFFYYGHVRFPCWCCCCCCCGGG
jgi:hypothetical protein